MLFYFFEDKMGLLLCRLNVMSKFFGSKPEAAILFSKDRNSEDQFSTGWSHLTHCLTVSRVAAVRRFFGSYNFKECQHRLGAFRSVSRPLSM